jgi:ABC-2 type transport system ATP-binding protein
VDHAIVTAGLTRRFGATLAVDGLDLEVPAGVMFGFLGPNGAGKSTTLKMLTGLLRPTSGSARILGLDVVRREVEVKRKIGVVPEELALFDRLTGSEYLRFVGRMYRLPADQIEARSAELLDLLDLAVHDRKLIVDYSHGMHKKLALAAALLPGPEVVFLDEPFEGIDAVSARLIRSILDQLLASGATVFLTSHILAIVEQLCSHVAVIHHGRLVAAGTMDQLRAGTMSLEDRFLELVGGDGLEPRGLSWLAGS